MQDPRTADDKSEKIEIENRPAEVLGQRHRMLSGGSVNIRFLTVPCQRIAFPIGFRYTERAKTDGTMAKKEEAAEEKAVATNRKARHEYIVLDTYEAGIVLTGTEVKSLRLGNVNIAEAFAQVKNGEVWLSGMHVSPYEQGSYANVDPLRRRKLLLHRKEIRKISGRLGESGLTLVPLKIYFHNRHAKVLIGICRGKREHDRREDIARREAERDIRRNYAR
jgi:SsrA-binding protein